MKLLGSRCSRLDGRCCFCIGASGGTDSACQPRPSGMDTDRRRALLCGTAIQSPTKQSSVETAASTAAPAGKALRFGNQIRSRPDLTTVRWATARRTTTASTLGRMAIGLMASTATTKRTATASTLGPRAADMMASGATVRRTANVFGTISQCNHYVIAPCDHQNYAHITRVVWMTKQQHSFYKLVQMKNIERNTE
jgi:hypothetical protein